MAKLKRYGDRGFSRDPLASPRAFLASLKIALETFSFVPRLPPFVLH